MVTAEAVDVPMEATVGVVLQVGESDPTTGCQQRGQSPDDARHVAHVVQRELAQDEVEGLVRQVIVLDVEPAGGPPGIRGIREHLAGDVHHCARDVRDDGRADVVDQGAAE